MLDLYNLLEENHARIVSRLVDTVPKQVGAYARMPKPELKQSIEHWLEAYTDLLVTSEDASLRTFFNYLAKVRAAQSFKLGDIQRALLCFLPVMRQVLQDAFREAHDGRAKYDQAMARVEKTAYDSVCSFADVFQEYLASRIDEHNEYLEEQNKQLGVDLSQFIMFRG